ncbi:MAG: rod shape-determining protein MreC [Clostridia bacterium]|nr:rod shape-determining protein MreC [Clostridia bacterium]
MRNVFRNKTTLWLIVTVLILSIAIGVLNAAKSEVSFLENALEVVISPVQKAFTSAGHGVSNFLGYFSNKKALEEEIDLLKKENAELRQHLIKSESAYNENEQLRKLLNLKSNNTEFELEAAEVIARNPSNWYNSLTVDKGAADGIAVNQTVLSSGNTLVGRVSEVGTTWSRITLVTDPGHAAGAQISRTGEYGVCEGDTAGSSEGNCRLSFVSKNADIIAGDTVVTSGLGGVYPKGLVIGKIQKIRPDIQGISQYATVKPEADFKSLNTVFIIQNDF